MDEARIKDHMRRQPLFEGLSDDDLDDLVRGAEVIDLEPGVQLIRQGDEGDRLYVVLEGELEVTVEQGGSEEPIGVRGAGEVVGEMALVERAPRNANVRAIAAGRVLAIDQQAFSQLLSCSSTAAPTILRTVVARLRSAEAMLLNQAKLAALGTMAAGLAHELNNPAAAIRRSAGQLGPAADALQRRAAAAASSGLDVGELGALAPPDRPDATASPPRLGGGERSRLEAELEDWLDAAGVDEPWDLAPALVGAGWRRETLERVLEPHANASRAAALALLGTRAELDDLVREARLASEAISRIVGAVKSYAYLDQAPVQDVDLHEGLETTLVILRHKLREGIEVVRDYASDLPAIEGYGSELNQVWTNLIDNAADAMGGRGVLTLRTRFDEREVRVEVTDDGPGIPPQARAKLFEPFFTTKRVGSGTGLGLHIVHSVVRRHGGSVEVESEPGATTFTVRLPRRRRARAAQAPESSSSR